MISSIFLIFICIFIFFWGGLKLGFTRFTSENKNFDRDNDDKQVDEDVFFPLDFSTHPEMA
jgi:hypothetical protein